MYCAATGIVPISKKKFQLANKNKSKLPEDLRNVKICWVPRKSRQQNIDTNHTNQHANIHAHTHISIHAHTQTCMHTQTSYHIYF